MFFFVYSEIKSVPENMTGSFDIVGTIPEMCDPSKHKQFPFVYSESKFVTENMAGSLDIVENIPEICDSSEQRQPSRSPIFDDRTFGLLLFIIFFFFFNEFI